MSCLCPSQDLGHALKLTTSGNVPAVPAAASLQADYVLSATEQSCAIPPPTCCFPPPRSSALLQSLGGRGGQPNGQRCQPVQKTERFRAAGLCLGQTMQGQTMRLCGWKEGGSVFGGGVRLAGLSEASLHNLSPRFGARRVLQG